MHTRGISLCLVVYRILKNETKCLSCQPSPSVVRLICGCTQTDPAVSSRRLMQSVRICASSRKIGREVVASALPSGQSAVALCPRKHDHELSPLHAFHRSGPGLLVHGTSHSVAFTRRKKRLMFEVFRQKRKELQKKWFRLDAVVLRLRSLPQAALHM